ncbi:hypothetical protein Tco_0017016 [Tanacetum coccineum]
MKVHVAYDRRGYGKDTMGAVARGYVNRVIKSNGGGGLGREAKWDFNDKRRFVDVVNGKHTSEEWDNMYKNVDAKNQKNSEANEMHMRVIQNACYVKNKDYVDRSEVARGTRRGGYIRRGDSFNRSAGRITWISILGVPVSCWGESAFQKIAALHGTILGMHTYRLEGNQHTVCGRVNIHTINKGLIKEDLQVKFKGKMHKLSVVEEAKDITNWAIQEAKQEDYVDESNKGNEKDIQVDEVNGKDSEEYNSKNGEDSNEKENRERATTDQTWIPFVMAKGKMKDQVFQGKQELATHSMECLQVPRKSMLVGSSNILHGEMNEKGIEVNTKDSGINEDLNEKCNDAKYISMQHDNVNVEWGGPNKEGLMGQGIGLKKEGNNEALEKETGADHYSLVCRRDKREVSLSSSVGSGGNRLKKKMEGIEGLGEDKKGISGAYKEFHEVDSDNNEVFRFGYATKVIMEYFVKISKKARILELKRRNLKNTILTSNTPYPSRKIRCIYCTNQSEQIEEVMAEIKTKTSMEEFVTNDQANYYSGITSIMVNGKAAYELKGKFLDDLRDNAFSGINGEDAVEHIEYFLKIVDPIDLPNVNYERLRLAVFPILLFRNASKWFDEFKGSITTWVDLTEIFFGKYYPPSHTCNAVGADAKRDPTNTVFKEWLALKFANHMMMDPFTKKVLWDFWKKRDNQEGVIDEEFSELEKANNDDEQEINEIFRIETNLFDYETPLCTEFKEFNYLLKIDTELFTHDIERTKTYEDYENKLNDELGETWSNDGVPYEICDHICKPFCFKNGKTKWPTYNSNDDGFCNGGELPGMVRVGYMTYFQDYEWYDELTDSSLKEEALKQKAIYEKSWGDASQSVIIFCAWLKTCFGNFHELDYELLVKLQDYWWKDEKEKEYEERCESFDNTTQEPPICKIRRFETIKYSFGQEEDYVAIKEYEYDDSTRTNEDACHAYQEIFRNMDEGWLVTRAE